MIEIESFTVNLLDSVGGGQDAMTWAIWGLGFAAVAGCLPDDNRHKEAPS
jgi:hypothetical protein